MTLRNRTLLILGGTLIILMAVMYFIASRILLGGFADLEEKSTRRDVSRAMTKIEDDMEELDRVAREWSTQDHTYLFVQTRDPQYISSNLLPESTWISNGLNLMMFIRNDGGIVYEGAFDLVGEKRIDVPESVHAHVTPASPLTRSAGRETGTKGIIMMAEGPMIFACQPIRGSGGETPAIGTLLWGRFLDEHQIRKLEDVTGLDFDIARLDGVLPEDYQAARAADSDGGPVTVVAQSDDTVSGYSEFRDIYDQPAFMLRIDAPRDVYKHGRTTTSYLIFSILAAGALFGLASMISLQKLVLSPISTLSSEVGLIGKRGDPSARVTRVGRADELSRLAGVINQTLENLERSKGELRRARDELQLRVEELSDKVTALQTLAEIDNEVIAMRDPQPLLDLVSRRAAGLMKTPRSSILLVGSNGEETLAASYGFGEGDPLCRCAAEEGAAGRCLSAPMIAEGERHGTLVVCDDRPHEWQEDDSQLLRLLAGQLAVALDEARLFKEELTRREELTALYDLSRALADAGPNADTILELVTRQAVEQVHVTYARIALEEEDGFVWRSAHPVRVMDSDLDVGRRLAPDKPFIRRTIESGNPMVFRDSDDFLNEQEREHLFVGIAHTVCVAPLRAGDRIMGMLVLGEARGEEREPFTEEKIRLANSIANQTASALARAELFEQLERSYLEMVMTLNRAVEAKDTYVSGHAERLSVMALAVGESMKMTQSELDDLHYGSILHDIGKIGIRDAVLKKAGRLTDDEWNEMRMHPSIGANILAPVPRLANASMIVRHHHERFDGKGYPDGLSGQDIPLGARVLAVVDTFSAITDKRTYKEARSREDAIWEITRRSGSQFDPVVVEAFIDVLQRGVF